MRKVALSFVCLAVVARLCAADWPVLKTYEGASLEKVKMPLGGIGTGTISLSGRGGLVDWEIFNEPSKGFVPATSYLWPPIYQPAFALRCETADGQRVARLLEGPVPLSEYEGDVGSRAVNQGYPRFGKAVFKAAYPLAQVALADGGMPVDVTLEAMNPLVPGDAAKSGLPVILLRWRLTNRSPSRVKASVVGTLVNSCGRAPRFADRKTPVVRDERRVEKDGLTGVCLSGRQVDTRKFRLLGGEIANAADGEFGLFVPASAGAVSTATDVRGVPAIDSWAMKNDCAIENKSAIQAVSSAALAGKSVGVAITEREIRPPFPVTLFLRPRTLTLGVGCKRGTDAAHLESCFRAFLHENGVSLLSVRAVATIDIKKDEAAILALCEKYRFPLQTYSAAALNAVPGVFAHSDFVMKTVGCGCVCERAAVLAGGGRLLVGKTAMEGVTFALAGEENV